MGWDPGPGGQKNAKTPPLVMFPPANTKPKTKKNSFWCQLEDLLNL